MTTNQFSHYYYTNVLFCERSEKVQTFAYMQMHAHNMPFNDTELSRYAFTTLTIDKAQRDTVFLSQLCSAVCMQFGNTKGCIQKK